MPDYCELSNPVNFQGNPPEEGEFWNFQYASCAETAITEISDGTYTAYISTKINIADLFFIGIVSMLIAVLIFKVVWNFINVKIIKSKTIQDL